MDNSSNTGATHMAESAPVHIRKSITIRSTRQQVWDVLTGIDQWTQWQKNITEAAISGPLQPGSSFTMLNKGDNIAATLTDVAAPVFLSWQSRYPELQVLHYWIIAEQEDGLILVTDEECMTGTMAEANAAGMMAALETSKMEWLQYLKNECENKQNAS